MGRRSLRKIDPDIDLSRHLQTVEELPRPWDAAALFGRAAPLEVEVGSGKGLFLRDGGGRPAGRRFPRRGNRPAVRRVHRGGAGEAKSAQRGGRSRRRPAGLSRVCSRTLRSPRSTSTSPIRGGRSGTRSAASCGRRCCADIERTLQPGGSLHFWTDVEEYFHARWNCWPPHTRLEGPLEVPEAPAEHDMAYRTHFERRMRQHNEPVYRAEFRKRA